MSSRVEWSRVTDGGPTLVERDFTDQYGTAVDGGNIGVWMGSPMNSDGAIMEGTAEQIIDWAARLIQLVLKADELLRKSEPDPDSEDE